MRQVWRKGGIVTPDALEDKVALVTGATRGIGQLIGFALAREGADVVVAGGTAKELDCVPGTIHSAADEVRSSGGALAWSKGVEPWSLRPSTNSLLTRLWN